MRPLAWAAVPALLAGPALALDLPVGATRVLEEREPLGSHRLATGPWANGVLPLREVEGAVTREVWQIAAPDGTTLQLLTPMRDQLAAEGYSILLDCETEACGGFDFRQSVEVLPPPGMFVDLTDFRYLAAERGDDALSLLVSRGGETGFVQVVRVGPSVEATPAPAIAPDAPADPDPDPEASFAARIESEGRVVLDGLAFATGSGEIAADSNDVLADLAAYLAANPARRIALVGHTDAQGSLSANVALSKERAGAVADRLVETYRVPAEQLQAEGMGWLAPRATNLTPEGREANRRVEAVVLP